MKSTLVLALLAGLGAACSSTTDGGADGRGTAAFTTFGEEFIEKEIPAAAFTDGWSVKYDRFLIALHDVSVGDDGKEPTAKMADSKVFDMHKPGDKPVTSFDLPGKPYTHVSYRIGPATAASLLGEGATDADKQRLVAGGYSVYVEGTLANGAQSKRFAWGFKTNTLYDRCEGELGGKKTEGVVVTNGGTDTVQLTIHGDHLFYDDLQAANAKVRGGNLAAADADGDGTLTLEELAAVKLTHLPADKGSYGTGSAAGITDLRAFVEALSRTIGHYRGEGECFASAK